MKNNTRTLRLARKQPMTVSDMNQNPPVYLLRIGIIAQ